MYQILVERQLSEKMITLSSSVGKKGILCESLSYLFCEFLRFLSISPTHGNSAVLTNDQPGVYQSLGIVWNASAALLRP